MKFLFSLCILFFAFFFEAEGTSFDTKLIPDSLKKNAHAVVRYDSTLFRLISPGKAEVVRQKAITILDRHGEHFAQVFVVYDRNSKVNSFSGEMLDENGDRIRKIKKDEIRDNSLVGNYTLFQDDRYLSFEALNHSYPYTIVSSYTISYDGIISIDRWMPVPGYNVSVEKSIFTIVSPNEIAINTKPVHLKAEHEKEVHEAATFYRWELHNQKALENEPFSSSQINIFPVLWSTPEKFEYEGTSGSYNSWESFGKWEWELIKDKQKLPEPTLEKIAGLTKNAGSDKEKVKIVYQYLQNKTRYVSIQLGIGGWEPFPASVVDDVGYGDCKALSNYMVSLLKAAGINSYYAVIGNGSQKIKFPDFPSMGQANHVIVCVPLDNDTTWLECTNQKYPFGYLGKGNSGRYALLITPEGGKLVKTTEQEKEANTQIRKAEVRLDEQGNASVVADTRFAGLQFSNRHFLLSESKEEQKKWYLKNFTLNAPVLNSFDLVEKEENTPAISEKLDIYIPKHSIVSGPRIFVKPNILNTFSSPPPKTDNRKFEIELDFAYTDIDTIRFIIPGNWVPESIFDDVSIDSEFGNYSATVNYKENELVYVRKIEMNQGIWPPEKFEDFRNFYTSVWKSDQSSVVLIKK